MKKVIPIILILVLSGCIRKMPRQGDIAPELVLPDTQGSIVSTSQIKSKLLLLHFWTDWCKSCREEFPRLEQAYQELKPKGVEFVAVNIGQPAATSERFRQDFGITFPMLVDEKSQAKTLYKVSTFPTSYLIDQNGVILRRVVGWMDKSQIEIVFQSLQSQI